MNKQSIPFALVAVAALAGVALAGDMQYKVYGVAHASTDLLDNGDDSSIFVASNTSRIGIKGMFETDNELFDVIFKYEGWANFNAETENFLASRDSWVGLRGEWGEVTWGRRNTPFKMTGYDAVNTMFKERIADYRNATSYWSDLAWDIRIANSIFYRSPKIAESVVVDLQYVPEEGMDDALFFSSSATYHKDCLFVSAAFETRGAAYGTVADGEDQVGLRFGARYAKDELTVGAMYQTLTNLDGIDGNDVTVLGGVAGYEFMPQWIVKGQYFMMDPEGDDMAGGQLAFGVDYVLNEQATLYLMYAMTNADDNAYYTLGRGGHGQTYPYPQTANPNYDPADPDSGPEMIDDPARLGESQMGISVGLHVTW